MGRRGGRRGRPRSQLSVLLLNHYFLVVVDVNANFRGTFVEAYAADGVPTFAVGFAALHEIDGRGEVGRTDSSVGRVVHLPASGLTDDFFFAFQGEAQFIACSFGVAHVEEEHTVGIGHGYAANFCTTICGEHVAFLGFYAFGLGDDSHAGSTVVDVVAAGYGCVSIIARLSEIGWIHKGDNVVGIAFEHIAFANFHKLQCASPTPVTTGINGQHGKFTLRLDNVAGCCAVGVVGQSCAYGQVQRRDVANAIPIGFHRDGRELCIARDKEAMNVPAYKGSMEYIESIKADIDPNAYQLAKAQTEMAKYGIPQPFVTATLNNYYYQSGAPDLYKNLIIIDDKTEGDDTIRKVREVLFTIEYVWKWGNGTVDKLVIPEVLPGDTSTKVS